MKTAPPTPESPNPRRYLFGTALVLGTLGILLAVLFPRPRHEDATPRPLPADLPRTQLEQRNGLLYPPNVATPYTGWMTDHFRDGAVKVRTAVENGQLHGVSEAWTTNRTMELREHFVRNVPHGSRTTWHPNGQKRSEGQLVAGQQQGNYRQWFANGALAAEAEFKDGKAHGISRAWHPSGCLKAEALMRHGEVQTRHFYPDGERREPTLFATTHNP